MYKIKYITIIMILFLCGCDGTNYENRVLDSSNMSVGEVYEYSYVTDEGEIIAEYDPRIETEFSYIRTDRVPDYGDKMNKENTVRYYSLGVPEQKNNQKYDNGIYYSFEKTPRRKDWPVYLNEENVLKYNPTFYFMINTDNGKAQRLTWINGGYFLKIIDKEIDLDLLKSADHIELFKNDENIEDVLAWFDNRIVIDSHIYSLIEGSLFRATINENEETFLDGNCKNISYENGYIYYLHGGYKFYDNMLYRVKLDGTEKEQLSSIKCRDYCLTKNAVIYLTQNGSNLSIMKTAFSEDDTVEVLGTFEKEQYHDYHILGTIKDKIYVSVMNSRVIFESGKIELYEHKNGVLTLIHESDGTTNTNSFKPFIHGDSIFYLTNEGLFMFNPIERELTLIAEHYFTIPEYSIYD